MNSCILLNAGVGERFNGEKPKQFSDFHGLPLYKFTLDRLEQMPFIHDIVLVVHPEYLESLENCVSEKVSLIAGGKSRQESVRNGLNLVQGERVMIHETVRPLVTESQVLMGFDVVRYSEGASYYTDLVETLVMSNSDYITSTLDRSLYKNLQCPQFFQTEILKDAHERYQDNTFSDDTRLVIDMGGKVKLLKGGANLTKVTSRYDLLFLENL